jgi:hypothetical protein
MKVSKESRNLEIIARYHAGESSASIAASHGLTTMHLRKIFRLRKIPMRGSRKYTVNHSAFDLLTDDACYWIGFLMVDGHTRDNKISLGLKQSDKHHVEKFRSFVNSNSPIIDVPNDKGVFLGQPSSRFSIWSNKIATILNSHGVIHQKSLIAKALILQNNRHFWRGVVDGNGTVAAYKHNNKWGVHVRPVLTLCGSKSLMQQFSEFVYSVIGEPRKTVRKTATTYVVSVYTHQAIAMIKILYGQCSVALDRKAAAAALIVSPDFSMAIRH